MSISSVEQAEIQPRHGSTLLLFNLSVQTQGKSFFLDISIGSRAIEAATALTGHPELPINSNKGHKGSVSVGTMRFTKLLWALMGSAGLAHAFPSSLKYREAPTGGQGSPQDLVTMDEHSLLVRGERVFFYSGEFHPFRIPVPGLWLDVFQKIKALGFNGVSFYVDWSLLEGQQGHLRMDGIFDLKPFFDAAAEAGIYLIARPGPYINAETSAGGFPGWLLRVPCILRSDCAEYEEATKDYLAAIGKVIAEAQITNGGPVVLVQPENEYADWPDVPTDEFPLEFNRKYMAFVEQQLRDAGIVVPLIDNDNLVLGNWAPGTGLGAVDLYGIDAYPLRYDCAAPTSWTPNEIPTDWYTLHEEESPSTPFAVPEFQGGSGTGYGAVSQDMCNALIGPDALRVVYKNNYSFGVKLMNIYMTYGGTNWGNLGYMAGDTSYDYGASINELRQIWREKYSEQKLQANFFKVSPAYLTAIPGNLTNSSYADTALVTTTPLFGKQRSNFYVVRHSDFTSTDNTEYSITLPTSAGSVTIPQLSGRLSLLGRDSKFMVTDYDVGGTNLIYSSADIFTWARQEHGSRAVLIMYGTQGETHEFAMPSEAGRPTISGASLKTKQKGSMTVVNWEVTPEKQTVYFEKAQLEVIMLWRNDAYNYWTIDLPAPPPIDNYWSPSKSSVIVRGGYLWRSAAIEGSELQLTGDFNVTTDVDLVFEPTGKVDRITVNGQPLRTSSSGGGLTGEVRYEPPSIHLPDFSRATWKYLDSLPEVQREYDDSRWTECDHKTTTNNQRNLTTPTSLYSLDYGYHTSSLLYRGHFTSNGQEDMIKLNVSGGSTFANSVYLNSVFLGSYIGVPGVQFNEITLSVPGGVARRGERCVVTVVIDLMGQDEEPPGTDQIKFPQGILDYDVGGHSDSRDVTWRMTGNLGGENYRDLARGPRNEGGFYAERQGYHQPSPPDAHWEVSSPITRGLSGPGIGFYTTAFELNLPEGYDIPMTFTFANNSASVGAYRTLLFVNGYQFGELIPYMGPESAFPVPEGILNYSGANTVAVTIWAFEESGARLGGLQLEAPMPVMSSMRRPQPAPQPAWSPRPGAY